MSRMKQKCPEPRASPQVAVGRAERDPRPSRRALRGGRAGNRFRPRTVWALAVPPSAARPEADVGSSSRQGASPRGAPREPREGASASVLLTGRAWPRWFPKSRGQTGGRPGRRSWERGDPGAAQRPGGAGGSGALQPGAALGGFRCTYNRRGLFPFRSSSLGGGGRGRGDPPGVRCPLPRAPPGASAF